MTIIIYFNKYSMPSHILGISVFSVIWFPCGFNIVIYMDNALTPLPLFCLLVLVLCKLKITVLLFLVTLP
jgi:hypothetical protein